MRPLQYQIPPPSSSTSTTSNASTTSADDDTNSPRAAATTSSSVARLSRIFDMPPIPPMPSTSSNATVPPSRARNLSAGAVIAQRQQLPIATSVGNASRLPLPGGGGSGVSGPTGSIIKSTSTGTINAQARVPPPKVAPKPQSLRPPSVIIARSPSDSGAGSDPFSDGDDDLNSGSLVTARESSSGDASTIATKGRVAERIAALAAAAAATSPALVPSPISPDLRHKSTSNEGAGQRSSIYSTIPQVTVVTPPSPLPASAPAGYHRNLQLTQRKKPPPPPSRPSSAVRKDRPSVASSSDAGKSAGAVAAATQEILKQLQSRHDTPTPSYANSQLRSPASSSTSDIQHTANSPKPPRASPISTNTMSRPTADDERDDDDNSTTSSSYLKSCTTTSTIAGAAANTATTTRTWRPPAQNDVIARRPMNDATVSHHSNISSSHGHFPPSPPSIGRDDSAESFVSGGIGSDDGAATSIADGGGLTKREKVIRELLESERRFLSDMQTLREIYYAPSLEESNGLSATDVKILFTTPNLDAVIAISTEFLADLESASTDTPEWIGGAFLKHMKGIEDVYATYCKHNEAAMTKLMELASPDCPAPTKEFLKDCQMQLQGRTAAWDLSSLIIKPVQRVLKYPLLIKQLLKETPPKHNDFDSLVECSLEIEKVADNINEFKRRKDTVEKYIEGKGKKNAMHGITKKFTRGVQGLRQATGTGGDVTVDTEFDDLVQQTYSLFGRAQVLHRDLNVWVKAVRDYLVLQEAIAASLEEVYQLAPTAKGNSGYKHVAFEYRNACARLAAGAWKNAEDQVRKVIVPLLTTLVSMFKDPLLVIKKRDKKRLDFDRARAIKSKGDTVDKALESSAEDYHALHNELVSELPKFLNLATQYMDIVMVHIVDLQADVYSEIRNQLEPVAESLANSSAVRRNSHVGLKSGVSRRWPQGEIIGRFKEAVEASFDVDATVREMVLLERWRVDVFKNPKWENPAAGSGHGAAAPASSPSGGLSRVSTTKRMTMFGFGTSASSPRSEDARSRQSSTSNRERDKGGQKGAHHDDRGDGASDDDKGSLRRRPTQQQQQQQQQLHLQLQRHQHEQMYRQEQYSNDDYNGDEHDEADDETELPQQSGRIVNFLATAMFSFDAEVDDEVDLQAGDIVRVTRMGGRGGEASEEWWMGSVGGRLGWFPAAFVETADR